MAKNYVKPGEHIPFTASGAISSGAAVVIGSLLGVSLTTLASSEVGEAAIEGVWELPKLSSAVIGNGAKLHWDVSAGEFIIASTATGDLENCAVAVEAAGSGVTTVKAKLTPNTGAIKA